jgi:ubiquilin
MMNSNPQMQQMAAQNPQLRAMLSNPEQMRQMMNPANLQAMMQMQQSMQTLQGSGLMPQGGGMPPAGGGGMGGGGWGAPAGAAQSSSIGGLDFSALLGGAGRSGSGSGSMPAQTVPAAPAVRFAEQIRQLNGMGFTDDGANIRALTATNGNVNAAVDRLLSGI